MARRTKVKQTAREKWHAEQKAEQAAFDARMAAATPRPDPYRLEATLASWDRWVQGQRARDEDLAQYEFLIDLAEADDRYGEALVRAELESDRARRLHLLKAAAARRKVHVNRAEDRVELASRYDAGFVARDHLAMVAQLVEPLAFEDGKYGVRFDTTRQPRNDPADDTDRPTGRCNTLALRDNRGFLRALVVLPGTEEVLAQALIVTLDQFAPENPKSSPFAWDPSRDYHVR